MPSIYGQRIYSANRYSWLDQWMRQPCEPDVWYKTGHAPSDWALETCAPAAWLEANCGPVPPPWEPGDIEIALPGSGTIAGAVWPVGSLSGKVGITGTIAGQVQPVGSLSGQRGIVGTITGAVQPVGEITGVLAPPPDRGTITGVTIPVGSLQGKVLGPGHFVGISPQFGPIHYTTLHVSSYATQNDTETMDHLGVVGAGATGLSRDRIPAGNVVWKIFVETASIDARIGIIQEVIAVDGNLQYPPGFAYQGICYLRNGHAYDGFDRPVGGPTWGSGAYLLMAYKSSTGQVWIGTTDFNGTNPVWFGDPFAGTGQIGGFGFTALPHVAIFGVGSDAGDVFRFMTPLASELP